MTAMQPYEAWLFFGADDIDEVNKEYARIRDEAEDGSLFYALQDALVEVVTVIAAEMDRGSEQLWVLRDGKLGRHESWQVRRAFQ